MKIKTGSLIMSLALMVCFSFVFAPIHAVSQTTSPESEKAALANQAQVQKAENLALATMEKAQAEIEKAENNVAAAENNLAAVNPADTAAVNAAQAQLAAAVDALSHALANSTGVSAGEISGMRSSGMGWGQIAHALGIHPGTLGLGHTKSGKDREQAMATARDFSKGTSDKDHGQKGFGTDKASEGKGKDNASGKGSQGSGKGSDGGGKGSDGGGKGGGKNN